MLPNHEPSAKTASEQMKKKTSKSLAFMEGLHAYIISDPQFRKNTRDKTEKQIQAELRPLIIRYLEKYYESVGVSDYAQKANRSFYWEGQEGALGRGRPPVFGSRNYPDFIILSPYLIAIEYAQSPHGSAVKRGIGQSIVHTMCCEYDFVYYLFHDESQDKRVESSIVGPIESSIINKAWEDFNVMLRFV